MKIKLVALTMIAVFLASFALSVTPAVSATTPSRDLEPIYDMPSLDDEAYMEKYGSMEPDTGNPWTIMVSDDYLGGEYPQDFELFGEGVYCRMWIGLNDTYEDYKDADGNYHFFYGYARPGPEDIITPQNLTYLINHFDSQIYPTNTLYFGVPKERPPGNVKIDMLIFNIRDWAFYDPEAYWYIAGYFSASISTINNANIIHIDTNRWDERLGPPPRPRPWVVEATVSHEFEHLIHNDVDPDELSWVDEGLAMYSEFLNGYGHPDGDIRYYIVYHHFTSLTVWLGGLENYGAVYLFTLYLSEHYGGIPTIMALVREQGNGIEGVNNVLEDLGYTKRFDDIFQDWAIANYLDDTTFADGIYGYYSLDIPSADTRWWSMPYAVWYLSYLGYFEGVIDRPMYPYTGGDVFAPYTVHYVHFEDAEPRLRVDFDGDDFAGILPYSGSYEWHSNMGNWLWNRMHQTFEIPSTGATLKFWTNYQIEQDWDYGYVEVHDLTTDEWTTVTGLRTTTTLVILQDNPNVPAGFEPMDYYAAGKWNAFTGFAGAWYQEVMDLSAFAGHTIELYFTYWTDAAWMEAGWYIDNIEIPEIGFFDDVEIGPNGWTTTTWYRTTGLVENDFKVNFLQTVKYESIHGYTEITKIMPMTTDDATEKGSITISMPHFKKIDYEPAVMIVANQPGWDSVLSTGYTFKAV